MCRKTIGCFENFCLFLGFAPSEGSLLDQGKEPGELVSQIVEFADCTTAVDKNP